MGDTFPIRAPTPRSPRKHGWEDPNTCAEVRALYEGTSLLDAYAEGLHRGFATTMLVMVHLEKGEENLEFIPRITNIPHDEVWKETVSVCNRMGDNLQWWVAMHQAVRKLIREPRGKVPKYRGPTVRLMRDAP